jgi:hypothetical protein
VGKILKSKQATEATFAIIETFSKNRQLSRSIQELSIVQDKEEEKLKMLIPELLVANGVSDELAGLIWGSAWEKRIIA